MGCYNKYDCRKRQYSLEHGGERFRAAPEVVVTHPWWCDEKRFYRSFYMWSIGDGALVKMFPGYTYQDHTPDSAETFLLSTFLLITGSGTWLLFQYYVIILFALKLLIATLLGNIIHDLYCHFWRDISRTHAIEFTLNGMVGTSCHGKHLGEDSQRNGARHWRRLRVHSLGYAI